MEIFDVSVPVRTGMPVYPGDPEVRLERVSESPVISRLEFGVHTGTHVDAPLHFVEGGAGSEELRLDVLVGPCEVVDGAGVAERVLVKGAAELDGGAARGSSTAASGSSASIRCRSATRKRIACCSARVSSWSKGST
ncbi:MAG TPA: cyclase family protein [Gaiellaceae bacterium]|nr:cyclase family protein [Gaiellaceae bacterium]